MNQSEKGNMSSNFESNRPIPPSCNDHCAEHNQSDDVINKPVGGSRTVPSYGGSPGFCVSATLGLMAQSNEATAIAVRFALEEEAKIIDDDDNSTRGAALRAIILRGVCRMPVVVGIGPDGQRTPADITPTTTAATSSQHPSSNINPQHNDTSPPTS